MVVAGKRYVLVEEELLDHGIAEKRIGTLEKISCSVGEVKAFVNSARASGDKPSHTSIVGQVTRIKDYVNRNSSQADDIVLSHQTSKAIGIQSNLKFPLAPYVAKLNEVFAVSGTRYVLSDNLILSDEETIFQNAKDVLRFSYL